jgi:succinoglycan biosynthesis transport protein ExoP
MKELQHIPNRSVEDLAPAAFTNGHRPVPEMPGPGLKRDYAGTLEYWQMIRRHPATVILATFLGGLIAFLFTLPDARIYQTRTAMEIQGLNDNFLNMKGVNATEEATSSYSPDYDIQTQVRILQSRTLLKRVLDKLEAKGMTENLQPSDRLSAWRKALKIATPTQEALWRQALAMAAGNVKVKSSGTNRIVEVSCDSTSRQLAVDFCNTLTAEYIEQNLEARWKSTEYTGQWLTKQLQDIKVNLEKSQEQLQSHARATGLVFTDEKKTADETKLSDLQKTVSEAQTDRINKQSKYEMAMASPVGALPDVLDDTSLKDSQKAITDLQTRLAQLRISYTVNHPEVKKVQAQIASLEVTLQRERSNIVTRIRNEYEAAQRREKLLASAYQGQAARVSAQADAEAHHSLLQRDVDGSRLLYESMLQKLKEASIASALRASNIRVVDPAEKPGAPYKPDVRQSVTVGLLAGLCLGVVMVVLRERADRTLQDPGDPAYYLNLPELGVVPVGQLLGAPGTKRLPGQVAAAGENGKSPGPGVDERVELVSWNQKSSLLAESFRTTLTSILFSGQNGDRPRLLVFTSASPKEGKTTVVCNLGISLAEINHSVLLIDADMRRPRLHSVFGVENDRGLSDLLRESAPFGVDVLEAACVPTNIPGLFVLPSGGSRHSASTLVHSARFPELLKLARERFDTVLVDTPPMVNISDARVVARFADALILVVRSAVTTRDAALLAKRRFAEDGIPILGTILNWWNPKTPGYGYYRYYYAGYYHYYGNGNGTANAAVNGDGNGAGVASGDEDRS